MGSCAHQQVSRAPDSLKSDCLSAAQLILKNYSTPETLPKSTARQFRILEAARRNSALGSVVELFSKNPQHETFARFLSLEPHDAFERLRLALLAEAGMDLEAQNLSNDAKIFLRDLSKNEFPGENKFPVKIKASSPRFPRFFPELRTVSQVNVLQVGNLSEMKWLMQNGISSPARQRGDQAVQELERQLMKDAPLFYEVADPNFANQWIREKWSPFIRGLDSVNLLQPEIESNLVKLREGEIEGFAVFSINGERAVYIPGSGTSPSYVLSGSVEAREISEIHFFGNGPGGIIISRLRRRAQGFHSEVVSLADLFHR